MAQPGSYRCLRISLSAETRHTYIPHRDISDYGGIDYSRRCLHSTLKDLSPAEFKEISLEKNHFHRRANGARSSLDLYKIRNVLYVIPDPTKRHDDAQRTCRDDPPRARHTRSNAP